MSRKSKILNPRLVGAGIGGLIAGLPATQMAYSTIIQNGPPQTLSDHFVAGVGALAAGLGAAIPAMWAATAGVEATQHYQSQCHKGKSRKRAAVIALKKSIRR